MSKTRAYNIDCMEYMATLLDKAFQLAIVDPPYMDTFKITAKDRMASINQYNLDSLNNNTPDQDYLMNYLGLVKIK